VKSDLEALGLRVALRSDDQWELAPPDAVVVNSTGELRDWYRCATVVFVGKSLLHKGGQNPAEPIVCGRAVIVGPHMRNFDVLIRQLVRHDGIVQISDSSELTAAAAVLIASPETRHRMVSRGRDVIESHRGSTARTCEIVELHHG
jgi:3-deoxy-D-manno-octulosonic-acid transferase